METYDIECQRCFRFFQSYDPSVYFCPECEKKLTRLRKYIDKYEETKGMEF